MTQKPKALLILDIVTALAFAASFYMSLVFAPMERVMGNVQRVFYHHVAAGWAGMIGFGLALVAAIIYLVRGDRKWDMISLAGVEVGLVFSFINIVTGSIWARPIWNTWWTWDPRLVTATVMELVYIAYLMLRAGIEDPDRRARFGAVYAIIGFLSVPLSFFSIRIWRTIHPVVILSNTPSGDGAFDMTADMRTAFFFALATFTLVGIDMLWHRIRLGQMSDKVEQLKLDAMS
jgi:heme exporter protein C